ncbi:PREDICTED: uncharacterized protein LOC109217912 [Nicotiana attenuata]|uniref:uncharacterized protein LOC109217912 n=1 Tax=Nicotiana attenuata TaxID=49451 RepID=UPI000904BE90|nr:PREDICTED: uncharacterized protein LOC109217912 [Nicotiana attenuata]
MHRNSALYCPKANGAVEAANRNIKKILRKMVQGSRQWHEKLTFAMLGYRTTVRTSVGATPYLLVYGTKAVIPAEVKIPSLRIVAEAETNDDEWVKTRLEQLNIEGKYVDMAVNSDAVKRYYGPYHEESMAQRQEILFRILQEESMAQISSFSAVQDPPE